MEEETLFSSISGIEAMEDLNNLRLKQFSELLLMGFHIFMKQE
jgi:hypothetical protein